MVWVDRRESAPRLQERTVVAAGRALPDGEGAAAGLRRPARPPVLLARQPVPRLLQRQQRYSHVYVYHSVYVVKINSYLKLLLVPSVEQ